jgi:hypothetical protein
MGQKTTLGVVRVNRLPGFRLSMAVQPFTNIGIAARTERAPAAPECADYPYELNFTIGLARGWAVVTVWKPFWKSPLPVAFYFDVVVLRFNKMIAKSKFRIVVRRPLPLSLSPGGGEGNHAANGWRRGL